MVGINSKEYIERKIGVIAQTDLKEILESNKVSMDEIQWLQSEKYSKQTFSLQFPLLKKIDSTRDYGEQKKDHLGRSRYYKEPITIHGESFFLSSQWYEKSKPYLIKWIESRKS